jgi:hypothetical protein
MQKYLISCPQNQILTSLEKLHKEHKTTQNLLNDRFLQNKIIKINENEFFVGFVEEHEN